MTAPSRFLPDGFDTSSSITLIAGRGDYPGLVSKRIQEAGCLLNLIALKGETEEPIWNAFQDDKRRMIKVGQIGKLVKGLIGFKTRFVVMVGQIQPTRLFGGFQPDLRAVKILASLKERNASTIFGAIVREIEDAGCTVLDARAFLDNDVATVGTMTGDSSVPAEYLEHGIRIASECSRLHIGQGVVVRKGTVLAVEAFEGTDQMLRRAGEFKTDEKIFVKIPHPDHDYRFDVPVFGPQTLDSMINAGINTAALAANRTVMLEKEAVLERARKNKIEILGFEV